MKTLFTPLSIVCFLVFAALTSCNKLKDLIKVNVPLQTAEISFTIEPQTAGTKSLAGFQVNINIDSILKAENSKLGMDNIKSVKVKSCTIVAQNASDENNFGNLSACEASLAADSGPYVKFAEITSNPETFSSSLNIPVSDVELKDYFYTNVLKYQLSGTVRKATTATLHCTATVKFDIEAGL